MAHGTHERRGRESCAQCETPQSLGLGQSVRAFPNPSPLWQQLRPTSEAAFAASDSSHVSLHRQRPPVRPPWLHDPSWPSP
jgi:hypothetical protein